MTSHHNLHTNTASLPSLLLFPIQSHTFAHFYVGKSPHHDSRYDNNCYVQRLHGDVNKLHHQTAELPNFQGDKASTCLAAMQSNLCPAPATHCSKAQIRLKNGGFDCCSMFLQNLLYKSNLSPASLPLSEDPAGSTCLCLDLQSDVTSRSMYVPAVSHTTPRPPCVNVCRCAEVKLLSTDH